jgi:hypothetical protein
MQPPHRCGPAVAFHAGFTVMVASYSTVSKETNESENHCDKEQTRCHFRHCCEQWPSSDLRASEARVDLLGSCREEAKPVTTHKGAEELEYDVHTRNRHVISRRDFIISSVIGVAAQAYAAPESVAGMTIVHPQDASPLEMLAAREVCRYIYLRTGMLLPISPGGDVEPACGAAHP